MKLSTLLSALALGITVQSQAQQNVGFKQSVLVSPQVNQDKTVTFRLEAPKAKAVKVVGDWEADKGEGTMKKNRNGVWEYTTPVLPSEMYTYRFEVDGTKNIDPLNPFTRRDVGNVFSYFFVDGGAGDYFQVHDVPHGSVQTVWYPSKGLHQNYRRMNIYLPPGYDTSNRSYPVFYLLHGSGGDENAWLDLGFINRVMDNLIAEGKAQPMIVVLPNANPASQAVAGETDQNLAFKPIMTNLMPDYKNGLFENAFPEIVQYVDSHYRTLTDRDHRAIAGLSMGGFNTLYISANYPDYFSYVGLFSPGLNPAGINFDQPAYDKIDQKLTKLKQLGCKLYWIGIGSADGLVPFVNEYRAKLDKIGLKYTYHESSRGHLWSNWREYMLLFAPQLFK